jgi:hypothetical protein
MKLARHISEKEKTLIDNIKVNLSNIQVQEKEAVSKYILAFMDAILVNSAYSIQERLMGLEFIRNISEIISSEVDESAIVRKLRYQLGDLDFSNDELVEFLGLLAKKTKTTLIDDGWLKKIGVGVFILLAALIVIVIITLVGGKGAASDIVGDALREPIGDLFDKLRESQRKKRGF